MHWLLRAECNPQVEHLTRLHSDCGRIAAQAGVVVGDIPAAFAVAGLDLDP